MRSTDILNVMLIIFVTFQDQHHVFDRLFVRATVRPLATRSLVRSEL